MHIALYCVCAVLTLLVFSISSVAEGLDPLPNPSRVTLFAASSKVPYANSKGTREEKQVHSFRIPGLVEVDGVLVTIAEANYDSSGVVSTIDIAATYSVDNGKTWKTEVIIKNSGASSVSRVVEPTVVVKEKKIYVLVGSFSKSNEFWANHYNDNDWDPLLVVGEVKTSTSAEGVTTASITWTNPVSLKNEFIKQKPQSYWILFVGGTRTGLLMRNGTIVFPLQIATGIGPASSIMYSNDDGNTWTFAKGFSSDFGASEPSVVEWGDKLIMSCRMEDDTRRVYESFNMGAKWVESKYRLSRVWGNAPDRKGPGTPGSFIAVEIEGMRVMLFSIPLNTKKDRNRDRLNLWMTDNNRIFNVGQVSHDDENTGFSSLLYHGDKLYCAHEVNNGYAFSIVLATLDNHLERIKSTVKSWKENDKKLSDLCIPVDPASTDEKRKSCGDKITTSGLVGWLSGDLKENSWKDKYGCLDAKVTNGISTPYGAKFYGSGAGALWPMSPRGQNRRYLFVENAFTLTAIVSIHEVPEHGKSYPVLGGSWSYKGEKEVIALSYNSDRKWVPEYGKLRGRPTQSWKLNRKYHVALSLENTGHAIHRGMEADVIYTYSVHVDGKCLACNRTVINLFRSEEGMKKFFIGGPEDYQKDMKGYITVSNVMLYNRKLSDKEIMTLSRSKYMIDERTKTISPSATLSLTPSLSLDPSAHVPKAKVPIPSPGGGEQTNSAPTTHSASGSAPIQTKTVDEQKSDDKSINQNTQAALPQPDSTAVPQTKDNKVSASTLPAKPTGEGGAGVDTTPEDESANTKPTNHRGGNPSSEPKEEGSAAPPTEKNTDTNTDTSTRTSTSTSTSTSTITRTITSTIAIISTSVPVEVPSNRDSGDTSVTGLNPLNGEESKSDPPQNASDKQKKSSDGSSDASGRTHGPLLSFLLSALLGFAAFY